MTPGAAPGGDDKPRSKVVDYLVYLLVRVLVAVLQALPLAAACRLADFFAWLAYRVNRRHREVARDNLRHAFPELSPDEVEALVVDVYRHCLLLLVEIIHLPRRVHGHNWRAYQDYVRTETGRRALGALLSHRRLMLVTGHLGNWEMSSYVFGILGFRLSAIARPLDNPYLDAWLRRFRQRTGQTMLAKKGEYDRILDVLVSGRVLGTLADQDAGQRGVFVDFFGRPASTHKAVALLALEHSVVLVVAASCRVGGPLRYCLYLEDVIDPEEYRGRPDAVKAITQRYTAALERLVRRHPEQYFWLHRRWKHRPAAKKGRAA
jgi:KDO2-lipid IV(A) lauroyltransferase